MKSRRCIAFLKLRGRINQNRKLRLAEWGEAQFALRKFVRRHRPQWVISVVSDPATAVGIRSSANGHDILEAISDDTIEYPAARYAVIFLDYRINLNGSGHHACVLRGRTRQADPADRFAPSIRQQSRGSFHGTSELAGKLL